VDELLGLHAGAGREVTGQSSNRRQEGGHELPGRLRVTGVGRYDQIAFLLRGQLLRTWGQTIPMLERRPDSPTPAQARCEFLGFGRPWLIGMVCRQAPHGGQDEQH
jgi:hypothetical protein